jgi:hypothetical protein
LSKSHDNVHTITGGLGAANKLRLTSFLLEATHTVTAAEATGLASKAGIDANEIYSIITNAAGNSSAYEELVPHMLQGDSQLQPSIESLLHKIVSCSRGERRCHLFKWDVQLAYTDLEHCHGFVQKSQLPFTTVLCQ